MNNSFHRRNYDFISPVVAWLDPSAVPRYALWCLRLEIDLSNYIHIPLPVRPRPSFISWLRWLNLWRWNMLMSWYHFSTLFEILWFTSSFVQQGHPFCYKFLLLNAVDVFSFIKKITMRLEAHTGDPNHILATIMMSTNSLKVCNVILQIWISTNTWRTPILTICGLPTIMCTLIT